MVEGYRPENFERYSVTCGKCFCATSWESSKKNASFTWNRRVQSANPGKSSGQFADGSKMVPLTLENGFEITNADGTPIDWDVLGRKYKDKLCYCDIDGFYIGQDGQLVLMDDCGKSIEVDRGDYRIEVKLDKPANNTLTLDELRDMDGEPVWCDWMNVWALAYIDGVGELEFTYCDGSQNTFGELEECIGTYAKTWLAYRQKPEELNAD